MVVPLAYVAKQVKFLANNWLSPCLNILQPKWLRIFMNKLFGFFIWVDFVCLHWILVKKLHQRGNIITCWFKKIRKCTTVQTECGPRSFLGIGIFRWSWLMHIDRYNDEVCLNSIITVQKGSLGWDMHESIKVIMFSSSLSQRTAHKLPLKLKCCYLCVLILLLRLLA